MNKTNQFSAKTQYVTPWCRCAEIHATQCILAGSNDPGSRWHDAGAGIYGEDELNDNGEY